MALSKVYSALLLMPTSVFLEVVFRFSLLEPRIFSELPWSKDQVSRGFSLHDYAKRHSGSCLPELNAIVEQIVPEAVLATYDESTGRFVEDYKTLAQSFETLNAQYQVFDEVVARLSINLTRYLPPASESAMVRVVGLMELVRFFRLGDELAEIIRQI